MATKTLSISEDAYIKLVKLKREGESFSQVILRLTSEKGKASQILASLNQIDETDVDIKDVGDNISHVYEERKNRRLRKVEL